MKIKLKKEQLRKEMKKSKLTYDEISRITGIKRSKIVHAFCDSQSKEFIDKKEFEQILWAINWWETNNVMVIRKDKVTASDIGESV